MNQVEIPGGIEENHKSVKYTDGETTVSLTLKEKAEGDVWCLGQSIKLVTTKGTYRPKKVNDTTFLYKTRQYKVWVTLYQDKCTISWELYRLPKKYTVVRRGSKQEVLYGNLTEIEKAKMKERYIDNGGGTEGVNSNLTKD
jgi:hypothetical protein